MAGMTYPVPANEAERLRVLRSYKILDTNPEERFDELTAINRHIIVGFRTTPRL